MPVLVVANNQGVTREQYEAVMNNLDLSDDLPGGCYCRFAGPAPGGYRVVTVWESREVFEEFLNDRLAAAFQLVGRAVPNFEYWPIDSWMLSSEDPFKTPRFL